MALQFDTNIKKLFAGTIARVLGNNTRNIASGPWPVGVTVYSGAVPTAEHIVTNWGSYNSTATNFLIHFTDSRWNVPSYGQLVQMEIAPPAHAPSNAGIATWAILWAGAVSAASVSGNILPFNKFLVVSASDPTGSGVVRFASSTLALSDSVTILDGSISCNI